MSGLVRDGLANVVGELVLGSWSVEPFVLLGLRRRQPLRPEVHQQAEQQNMRRSHVEEVTWAAICRLVVHSIKQSMQSSRASNQLKQSIYCNARTAL